MTDQLPIDIAQELTAHGWRVTPLIGKIPIRKGWPSAALSAADVQEIWTDRPGADVGVVTGAREYGGSGLLVIDLDVKGENGFASLAVAQFELGALPDTYIAPTPSGGAHLYFAYPDHTKDWTSSKAWRPGIDIRASGGQVAFYPGAGTVQPLPSAWALALKRPPVDLTTRAAFAPLDLSELTPAQVESARTTADAEAVILVEQMREHDGRGKHLKLQDTATKLGSWLWLTHDPDRWPVEMLNACEEAHERNDAMDEWTGAKVWKSVLDFVANGSAHPKRPPAASNGTPMGNLADYGLALSTSTPRQLHTWDDIGNGERLVDSADGSLIFAIDAEQWLSYGGGVWSAESGPTLVRRACIDMLDGLTAAEASAYSDAPQTNPVTNRPMASIRDQFAVFVSKSRSANRIAAAVITASASPRVARRMADFDAEPLLLNVANGVVDLETGKLLEHGPGHLMTQQSPVIFDPTAASPLWEAFLSRVQPDPEMRDYLARVIGYTLTGSTAEHAVWIHYGTGGNGKSVFMDTISRVLGSYGQSVPRATLMVKRNEGIPNDIARMRGKRLLKSQETKAGTKLDMGLIKDLSGGEETSARHMRAEFFNFRPVGKIHLSTNHLPHVTSGNSVERRLRDVHWAVQVSETEKDVTLVDRLAATELSGILGWAVRGCRAWLAEGCLVTPASVLEGTLAHIAASDPLAEWLEVRVERVRGAQIEIAALYADYSTWAQSRGRRPMGDNTLSQALAERGFQLAKDPVTRRSVVENVTLKLQTASGGSFTDASWARAGSRSDEDAV